jgi:pimeloyl-ACP methyl ester carboxylesterase
MAAGLAVELVHTRTDDGLRLDGAWRPAAKVDPAVQVNTALLWLHGAGSNFYGSSLWEALNPTLVDLGLSLLSVNTRGHDLMTTLAAPEGARRGGAAYEVVDDCRLDIRAWLDFLRARGYHRIVVAGHSLGALKSIYSLAHETPADVAALIAISPPRLSYEAFSTGPRSADFLHDAQLAQSLVDAGKGHELLSITFPIPLVVAAYAHVDKYGPAERYDLLKWLPGVACPTLITFGSRELAASPGFIGLADRVEAIDPAREKLAVEVIAGGDHFYAATRPELSGRVQRWLKRRLSA